MSQFITDPGVEHCGSLILTLEPDPDPDPDRDGAVEPARCREIQAKMLFGDTEIKASALDVRTRRSVRVAVDFLCESNPKYQTKL